MGNSRIGGVVPAPEEVDGWCGCNCGLALAGVQ